MLWGHWLLYLKRIELGVSDIQIKVYVSALLSISLGPQPLILIFGEFYILFFFIESESIYITTNHG